MTQHSQKQETASKTRKRLVVGSSCNFGEGLAYFARIDIAEVGLR